MHSTRTMRAQRAYDKKKLGVFATIANILAYTNHTFSKKLPINSGSHQPRSDPEAGLGSKSFFVLFSHF